MKSLKTFYDTLQVPRKANIAALRVAHKKLSEHLQPDRNPDNPGAAAQQILLVNKALEVLTHPHAREAYDAWLGPRIGEADVPTLPEWVEPPNQSSGSTKVSSETLAPLPTLDLDGFAAEVAAKAKASASAPAAPAPATAAQTPDAPSGFAETQPYHPSDVDDLPDLEAPHRNAAASASAATAPTRPANSQRLVVRRSPALEALDWLRERPIALIAAALLCVLVIAFAPWMWHASFDALQSEVPATPALQPTYVEPPVQAVSAPAPVVEPVEAVEEPSVQPAQSKSVHKTKRRKVAKRGTEPKRTQEAIAPVQQPEPVAAPAPLDAGGHTGFAPKCRWVTPTNWSCK